MSTLRVYLFLMYVRNIAYFFLKRRITFEGSLSQIRGPIRLYGYGELVLGRGSRINSMFSLNPVGRHRTTVISLAKGARVIIGENTGISNAVIFSRCSVEIGNNCKIGGGVEIYDTDFHCMNYEMRRREIPGKIYGKEKPIKIEDDVFVGCNTTILKGSTIPVGAIIGAESVVAGQKIKPFEIWAGNPLRKIGDAK